MSEWWKVLGEPQGAWIDPSGIYRHLLWRSWPIDAPPLVFGLLNPSKADGERNDPTVRRLLGFAMREGAGGIVLVNASPFRATSPGDLTRNREAGVDVLDEARNEAALERARTFGPFILGWGSSIPPWMDRAARIMRQAGGPGLRCFGVTKMGEPRHPLYLPKTTPLEPFPRLP